MSPNISRMFFFDLIVLTSLPSHCSLYNYYKIITSTPPHPQSDVVREQHAEAVRENQMLRSRVELLTHQVHHIYS